ncbi:helix-turn-helix transcriptional regulator [Streptomyces sp. CC224B]|uniref:helix-turn-helix domain-containing protein n=1 Tax=Streptomyces sp. CC224B TaxID=3044571 RepID=UPI0024A87C16|nr:helix-turn-helix transcriptional regulator [Streptomyces sp. CC224B]
MPYADDNKGQRSGLCVAEARKARGLTQLQLAQRIPCSKSLIAQVERGHKPATPSLTAGAARALGVRLEQLTGQPYEDPRRGRVHARIPDADPGEAVETSRGAANLRKQVDMSERTIPGDIPEADTGNGMTLRVYAVNPQGTITSDSGTRRVDSMGVALPTRDTYPPCSCPSCVRKRARR